MPIRVLVGSLSNQLIYCYMFRIHTFDMFLYLSPEIEGGAYCHGKCIICDEESFRMYVSLGLTEYILKGGCLSIV